MVELIVGIGGIVFGLVTFVLGRRSGQHSERAIRDDVAAVPHMTAELVTQMLDPVAEPPTATDIDRGWQSQYPATAGYAPLSAGSPPMLLIEFPQGAHSARFLALDQSDAGGLRILGTIGNGVGARFHVREATDGGQEVVTLDYVEPLRDDRPLATMPTQPVYYRLTPTGFVEVGRGQVYDPVEAAWNIPRSVEPFLSREWVAEHRF